MDMRSRIQGQLNRFCFVDQSLFNIDPRQLMIVVMHHLAFSIVLDDSIRINLSSKSDAITIIVPRAPDESYANLSFNVIVEYSGPTNISTPITFTYTENPILSDVNPRDPLAM